MKNNKISWSIPTLLCAAVLICVYFMSVFLGVNDFSFTTVAGYFLTGCVLGYLAWLLLD